MKQERVWILVPVIICHISKAAGKQYTKRILPDFLIPYSPMRLDLVLSARTMREAGQSQESVARFLGCLDLRTVRRHLGRLDEVAAQASRRLAGELANLSQYVNLPEPDPVSSPLQRLLVLYEYAQKAAIGAGWELLELRKCLQAEYWNISCQKSISHVSRWSRPP